MIQTQASRLIKAKYFMQEDFLSAQLSSNPSYIWKNIWSSQGCRWRIGDGNSINIWQDPWLKNDSGLKLSTPIIKGL